MSILSDFEDRVAGAVEGLFAGAFRSPVQPVELAKALARAMDDGRVVGVGKVYAPLTYTVALSPEDADNLGAFTATLENELATYLTDHAREDGYTLSARPVVHFDIHDDLRMGRFRVSADLASTEGTAGGAPAEEAPAAAPAVPTLPATVTADDHDIVLRAPRAVVGRLAGCDICLPDHNVSRQHAAFVYEDGSWRIEDLGSTNGTFVNGARVAASLLADGDTIEVGATRLVYHAPRS
jgi:hypothetical protein